MERERLGNELRLNVSKVFREKEREAQGRLSYGQTALRRLVSVIGCGL